MLTRLRRRVGGDAGITLTELIVAMTITMIVMALGTTFFVTLEHAGTRAIAINENVATARVTLDDWTSLLRVADWFDSAQTDRFEEITPTEIVFWADLNNRTTADVNPVVPQKIALLLRTTDPTTGAGQLVEIRFVPGNPSAVQSVHLLAADITPTGGAGSAIFRPYSPAGGDMADPATTLGCVKNGQAVDGLCLQSLPAGAGMPDPQVSSSGTSATAGLRTGNPNLDVDSVLQSIGGITIAFTVTDPQAPPVDLQSAASVNSGWPT